MKNSFKSLELLFSSFGIPSDIDTDDNNVISGALDQDNPETIPYTDEEVDQLYKNELSVLKDAYGKII